jgi:hypothetical protein
MLFFNSKKKKIFLGLPSKGGGDKVQTITKYKPEIFNSKITFISCGGGTAAAISEKGRLYTIGNLLEYNNTHHFTRMKCIPKEAGRVTNVNLGYDNMCIMTGTFISKY